MSEKETDKLSKFSSFGDKETFSGFGNSRFQAEHGAASLKKKRKKIALATAALLLLIGATTGGYFYSTAEQHEVASTLSEIQPVVDDQAMQQNAAQQTQEAPRLKFETSYFEFRKATLTPATQAKLRKTAAVLRENKEIKVRVAGYADEIGTKRFNQKLSERRAHNAGRFLIKLGVDASRISIIGFGENRPIVMGKDEKSRQLNRRVEVDVIVAVQSVATKQ